LEQDRALDGFAMSRWDKFASQNDTWGKGPRRDARPSWRIAAALGAALGAKTKYTTSEDVFREISERVPEFRGMTYMTVGTRGRMLATHQAAAKPVPVS
jgi:predicted molibdopterin-dependent oxidoreductase YjgC